MFLAYRLDLLTAHPDPNNISCCIPPSQAKVSIFIDKDNSKVFAESEDTTYKEGAVWIGKLNLKRLSLLKKASRRMGNLQELYVAKP